MKQLLLNYHYYQPTVPAAQTLQQLNWESKFSSVISKCVFILFATGHYYYYYSSTLHISACWSDHGWTTTSHPGHWTISPSVTPHSEDRGRWSAGSSPGSSSLCTLQQIWWLTSSLTGRTEDWHRTLWTGVGGTTARSKPKSCWGGGLLQAHAHNIVSSSRLLLWLVPTHLNCNLTYLLILC